MLRMARRLAFGLLVLVGVALTAGCASDTTPGAVHVLHTSSDVGPIMAQYLDRGISRAEDNDAKLVVIELDTPGGLDTSMRAIVQRIERATVPIVVYVSPAGARAASAGTFITMAANVAVMAPNTSIGAASAINADGSDIGGTLGKKIENDAVSFLRGIAELRGRNADWAEQAVRDATSANESQAVMMHVVDFEADSLPALLATLDGTTTKTGAGQPVTLDGLTTAPIVHTNMTAWEHVLEFVADPTVASLLITLGFLGLLFELANPGLVLPGVGGAIAIVLGFIGFGTLAVHTAGLVLIGLALLFFVAELLHPSGFLAAGGVIALVAGAFTTFHGTSSSVQPPRVLAVVLLLVFGSFFASFVSMVVRARRQPAAPTGTAALVGQLATARTALAPDGFVFIQGERWAARIDHGSTGEGACVRVTGVDGFRLTVHKEDPQ